jgi:hypothetical protein
MCIRCQLSFSIESLPGDGLNKVKYCHVYKEALYLFILLKMNINLDGMPSVNSFLNYLSFIETFYRRGWSSGNALMFYSVRIRPGHRLSWSGFRYFPQSFQKMPGYFLN